MLARSVPPVDWVGRKLREVRRRLDRAEAELSALEGRPLGPPLGPIEPPGPVAILRVVLSCGGDPSGITVTITHPTTGATEFTLTADAAGFVAFQSVTGRTYNYAVTVPTGYAASSGSFTSAEINDPASNPKTVTLTPAAGYICFSGCTQPIRLNGTINDQFGNTSLTWTSPNTYAEGTSAAAAGTIAVFPGCGGVAAGTHRRTYRFAATGITILWEACGNPVGAGVYPVQSPGTGFTATATVAGTVTTCGPPFVLSCGFAGTNVDGTAAGERVYQAGSTTVTFTEVP